MTLAVSVPSVSAVRSFALAACLLVLCIAFAAPLRGQSGASISLSAPGWQAQQRGRLTTFRNGESGGILMAQPTAFSGTREQAFRNAVRASGGDADWRVIPVMLEQGYAGMLASGFAEVGGQRSYVIVVGLFHDTRMASVTLVDVGYKGRQTLQEEFGRVLKTARVADWPTEADRVAQRSAAGAGGGAGAGASANVLASGLYVTLGARSGVNSVGQVAVETGVNGLILADDGRFAISTTALTDGLDPYCEQRPRNCGRYQYVDGQLTRWRVATRQLETLGLYKRDQEVATRSGDDLLLDGARYQFIPPVQELTLDGQYQLLRGGAANRATGGRTNAAQQSVYGFAPNGRFFRGRYFAGFSTAGAATSAVTANSGRRAGRYSVSGHTLTLRYDDGETVRRGFFMFDDVPVIDGDMYQQLSPRNDH